MKSDILSDTVRISQEVANLRKQGHTILDLGVGETLVPLDQIIRKSLSNNSSAERFNYPPVTGLTDTIEAFCYYMRRRFSVSISSENSLITCGGKHASYLASRISLTKNDKAMLCRPYWPSFSAQAKICSATPVYVKSNDQFKISLSDLNDAYDEKCKLLYLNNAGNPSGALYSESELLNILQWAKDHNVLILSDEVYLAIDYEDTKSPSLATLDPDLEHSIIIQSCSKSFAMTGLRVGFLIANKNRIKQLTAMQSQTIGNTSALAQLAAKDALLNYEVIEKSLTKELKFRRDLMATHLMQKFKWKGAIPLTSLYYFLPISLFTNKPSSSLDLSVRLLKEAGVCVVPGSAFGEDKHLRLSFGASPDTIEKAMEDLYRWRSINE